MNLKAKSKEKTTEVKKVKAKEKVKKAPAAPDCRVRVGLAAARTSSGSAQTREMAKVRYLQRGAHGGPRCSLVQVQHSGVHGCQSIRRKALEKTKEKETEEKAMVAKELELYGGATLLLGISLTNSENGNKVKIIGKNLEKINGEKLDKIHSNQSAQSCEDLSR